MSSMLLDWVDGRIYDRPDCKGIDKCSYFVVGENHCECKYWHRTPVLGAPIKCARGDYR